MGYIQRTWTSCLFDKISQYHFVCDGCILLFKYSSLAQKLIFSSCHSLLGALRFFLFLFEPFASTKRWPYLFCDCSLCSVSQSSHLKYLNLWSALQSIHHMLHVGNLGTCICNYLCVGSSPFYKFLLNLQCLWLYEYS